MSENKKHWWQNQPLTISAVQCNLGDDDEWVLDEYVSKYGFSTEQNLHLVAKGHMGYYNEAEHGKKLDSYLKKSRKHGIREIVYNNTHCVGEALSKEHPDWLQLTKDGKPMPAYSIYNIVCANVNGAFHKNFIKELEMLCTHDIDGVFLDGPLMHEKGCYCDVCRADFEKRFGHSIYEATRLELQTMRIESATGHIREAYETIKRINPEIALYINNSALRADVTGSNTRKIYQYVDILGAEGGFHKAQIDPVGLWHVSSHAKHLEGISGDRLKGEKPLVCFFAGNESGIAYYLHSPAETVLAYAQSYANGSNIWYGVHFSPSEFKDKEAVLKAKEMNNFILSNKDVFSASKTCARVALMWSQNTANNYASSIGDSDFVAARKAGFPERGDHRGALLAYFNVLVRNHVQFDIIDEQSILERRIFDYDSVILPEVACIGDEAASIIKEYVKGGGNILGNFDVAMYNEDGSFADGSKLADVFGFTSSSPERVRSDIGTSFMFKQHDHEMLEGLTMDRIPAPLLNAKMSFSDDVDILMRNTDPMPSTYASIPTENRYPSVTCHKYGEGRAYYISGNIGETSLARNIRDHARIMCNFSGITSRPVVVSNASGLYEVVLRRQESRYILHIINLTGAMARPIESVVPLYNVPFELYLEGFGVEKENFSFRSLRNAKVENAVQSGSKLSFSLDKIDDYEVIVIE